MIGSDRMPSYSIENGREVVRENEKGWYFGHGQLILSAVVRHRFGVYVPFVLGRTESIFVEISFPHRPRDNEDRRFVGLSLGEIPSDRGKAQRSGTLETL
jgi:hypothetical protein